jgi:RHS repeat-associated protein
MMEGYPDEVKAVAGPCGTTPTAASTVADTRTFYDGPGTLASLGTFGSIGGTGNVTGTEAISGYDGSGNPVFPPKSAATFDAYGRGLTSTDANGNVTHTSYTPASGAQPAQTTVTNPLGWATTTVLDQARQLPDQVTDPNGAVTAQAHDALGRLTAVWLPGRSQASQSADETFAYSVTGTSPAAVTTSTLREDGSYSEDTKIYDGLLQLRQEQATPADNSAGRLLTDTFHDSHGWVVKTSAPYYDATTAPGTTTFAVADDQVPSQTVTSYDGQGRTTASQFYSLATLQWQTATAYPGADQTNVTPPAGGTATSTFTDGRGDTTATWAYTTATPTGKATDADVTSYAYTPAGQVASIADNAGNRWAYTYNLLGQKVTQSDPDAGASSYAYDANGNLASSTDARGQLLTYTYDALNRKTAEYAGSAPPANQLASWTYDTLAKGQPTSSTAYAGGTPGAAYTEAVTGYTPAYQPTGTSVTIPPAEGALAGTYTTTSTYTPNTGLLNSTAYSADGGLPPETVSNSYDLQGLLNAFGGATAYLDQTSYTPFGQPQRTTTGLYGKQLVLTSAYDQATSRLLQTTVNLQPDTSAVDTTNYTYNPTGSITSVSDAQGTGQNDLQCFGYDNLQRLVQAWTDTGGTTTAPGPSVSGIGGCTNSTPAQATVGGPAPYWQSYGYDLLGDRTSEVQHLPSGNVTQTLSYAGNGMSPAAQPDAVKSVTTTGPSGSSAATYSYDATGDTTGRSGSSALTIGYDPQGRTSSVTASGGTSNYLYDAGGNLLIQRDPGATILYLDGGAEELTLAGGTVTGQRFYPEPVGTTVVRSSSGTIGYLAANTQGTALESIDASSLAVTRRYYDPYGNPRGTVPGSWPNQHGYVGKPADPNTSLDLLGARQYDSATGRFLQVDPVLETSDPRQMGGYSYAADNPATHSDPTGLCAKAMPGDPPVNCNGQPVGGGGGGGGNGGGGNPTSTGGHPAHHPDSNPDVPPAVRATQKAVDKEINAAFAQMENLQNICEAGWVHNFGYCNPFLKFDKRNNAAIIAYVNDIIAGIPSIKPPDYIVASASICYTVACDGYSASGTKFGQTYHGPQAGVGLGPGVASASFQVVWGYLYGKVTPKRLDNFMSGFSYSVNATLGSSAPLVADPGLLRNPRAYSKVVTTLQATWGTLPHGFKNINSWGVEYGVSIGPPGVSASYSYNFPGP